MRRLPCRPAPSTCWASVRSGTPRPRLDAAPALGWPGLAEICAASPLPCVAIGGIGALDVPLVVDAGAAGLAVISAICGRPDPRRAAAELRVGLAGCRWSAVTAHRPTGHPPVVLTIAGSDPSGGAGIQADLKTFSALGAYGCAVMTALTAQNTRGVSGVLPIPAAFVRDQLLALTGDVALDAVKIGMVADADDRRGDRRCRCVEKALPQLFWTR